MTEVSVLIPYRASPERDPLLTYVLGWWQDTHPDWQVVVGRRDDGPWVKARAVADALARAAGDLLVVADADVICDGVGEATAAVLAGAAWAIPHRRVYRLTRDATAAVLGGGPLPSPLAGFGPRTRHHPAQRPGQIVRPRSGPIQEYHAGAAGGGMTALPRHLYERVPLDPRFAGWGQEDHAWATALRSLAGKPWRGEARMWHLWHPRQERTSRTVGSAEGRALRQRYTDAARSGPDAMAALLAGAVAPSLLPAPTDAGSNERGPTTL